MAEKKMRSEAGSSSSNSGGNESVVVDVGRRRSSCGYCKSGGHSSISHGLWAHSLTVDDYQALLDRGWRRSGCFLYKPEMEKTCCPSYTIRLKASDFVPSKEQLRVSKRMQRFLDGTLNVKESHEYTEPSTSRDSDSLHHNETSRAVPMDFVVDNVEQNDKLEHFMQYLSDQIDAVLHACIERGELPCEVQLPKASVKSVAQNKRKLLVEGSKDLLYTSNISFQIAAALRRANKNAQFLRLSGNSTEENKQSTESTPKMIAEMLSSFLNHLGEVSGLSIKACNGHINFYSTAKHPYSDAAFGKNAVPKESSSESGSRESCVKKPSRCLQAKGKSIEIRLKRSSFDPDEYELYRRYQIKVHNDAPDHVTESSYKRFLVDSPLVFVPSNGGSNTPPCGFGSFHQQYLINGRLVAVGVVDILPKCLSSKYLFWDPDLAFLSLGKYSALQEISWVRETQAHCSSLQYYYLGYYIHSCSKMRYKAAYRPSELLCPLRFQWVPFDIVKQLLDKKPYVVLSDFATLQNDESSQPSSSKNHMEQPNDLCQEESNDVPIDEDAEMSEVVYEDSDDGSDPETTSQPVEMEKGSVNDIMMGLKGMHLKYKDIQAAFVPSERIYMETQLRRYIRAVGIDLSQRMVYSLG